MQKNNRLLTPREAAFYLGITPTALNELLRLKKIKSHRESDFGLSYQMIHESDLEAFMDKLEQRETRRRNKAATKDVQTPKKPILGRAKAVPSQPKAA